MVVLSLLSQVVIFLLVVVVAPFLGDTTAQSIIPIEILDQVPDNCEVALDVAANCVLAEDNADSCLGPILDLFNDGLNIPDPEATSSSANTCNELVDLSCDFYDACGNCTTEFTAFLECLKVEFAAVVLENLAVICPEMNTTSIDDEEDGSEEDDETTDGSEEGDDETTDGSEEGDETTDGSEEDDESTDGSEEEEDGTSVDVIGNNSTSMDDFFNSTSLDLDSLEPECRNITLDYSDLVTCTVGPNVCSVRK